MAEQDPDVWRAVDAAFIEAFYEGKSSEVMPLHDINEQTADRIAVDFTPPVKDEVEYKAESPAIQANDTMAAAVGNRTLAGLIDSLRGKQDDSFDYPLSAWAAIIE